MLRRGCGISLPPRRCYYYEYTVVQSSLGNFIIMLSIQTLILSKSFFMKAQLTAAHRHRSSPYDHHNKEWSRNIMETCPWGITHLFPPC